MSERQNPDSSSLVTVDIGSVNTRAHYFDSVEGHYRLLASGTAPSTSTAPINDPNLGVLDALELIEQQTGRTLIGDNGLLIAPEEERGQGANALTATFSGGPPAKVITIGLLEGFSLQSVNHLVQSNYCHLLESFTLTARRNPEELIDTITQILPDIILFSGGTNSGASRSVIRMASYLALAIGLLPDDVKPDILFVGNEGLQPEIDNLLGQSGKLHFAPNIRPNLTDENIGPAAQVFRKLLFDFQTKNNEGFGQLSRLTSDRFSPSAAAFGRTVQFLSHVVDFPKGMLGVDLGASNTIIAAAFAGELNLNVYSQHGIGTGLSSLLKETHIEQIKRWLPIPISDRDILRYLYNKPLQPQTLPATEEELAIEHAAARQVIRHAIGQSLSSFPKEAVYPLPETVPWFDRILVSGATLSKSPRFSQSLMMVLDSLQPVGIATIVLDQSNLATSLGSGAEVNPMLSVQVLESSSFVNLATVITPVSKAPKKGVILRLQIVRDGEKQPIIEVEAGDFLSVPLAPGKAADIFVQPLQNVDIGLGSGNGGWVRRVAGSRFGLLVDARGRPLKMPSDETERIALLDKWNQALSDNA
jgi:hypothetical protein